MTNETSDKCKTIYELAQRVIALETQAREAERFSVERDRRYTDKWVSGEKNVDKTADELKVFKGEFYELVKTVKVLEAGASTGAGKTSTWAVVLSLVLAAAAIVGLFLKK